MITPYPVDQVYQILSSLGLPVTAQISGSLAQEPVAQALLQPFRVILADFDWAEMVKYLRWGGIDPPEQLYRVEPLASLAEWDTTLAALFNTEEEENRSKALLAFLPRSAPGDYYAISSLVWTGWATRCFCPTSCPQPGPGHLCPSPVCQTALLGKLRASPARPGFGGVLGPKRSRTGRFLLNPRAMLAQEFTVKPTSWRNGVRLLTPTAARGLSFRVAFVVGLNEGVLPRLTRRSWL